ncbi:MAG: hypothetical protein H6810_06045 [Phycisphaeraceae bacterium]|nr:MAG: hypothetical protein H6810_06045 [Phycisphaeraceae bacterium]
MERNEQVRALDDALQYARDGAELPELLREDIDDLIARRYKTGPSFRLDNGWRWFNFWLIVNIALGIVAGILGIPVTRAFGYGALLSAGVIIAVVYGRHGNRVMRTQRRRCASCGYDLSSHADAFAPDLISLECIGPQTCPECGTPWPLIP